MILAVEAENYRMLKSVRVELERFNVLIGPNASGKTTFLDVLCFISDIIKDGVQSAVSSRTSNFYDLCFDPTKPVSIGVEVEIPAHAWVESPNEFSFTDYACLRYEISVGIGDDDQALRVLQENLFMLPGGHGNLVRSSHPVGTEAGLMHHSVPRGWKKVVSKTEKGQDYFRDEKTSWNNMFRFGWDKSALGSMPDDPTRFPRSLAVRDLLRDGITHLALEPRVLRASSPPGRSSTLGREGANLPRLVRELQNRDPVLFNEWVAQLRDVVKGLADFSVWEREEDKHAILQATFSGSHPQPVPSWLLSDGTLRLMALTALSYAGRPDQHGVYLIEEPENGLHPQVVQAVFEALTSPGTGYQWVCASHSPVFLANVEMEQALIFRRDPGGWSTIKRIREIPELASWSGRVRMDDLLALGVLS